VSSAIKQNTYLPARRHTSLILDRKCSVTPAHSRFGDRCVTAAGPCILDNLKASLWDMEVRCTVLSRQLKTLMWLMFQSDCGASRQIIIAHREYSYLLTYLIFWKRWIRYYGRSVERSVPGTLSDQSFLLLEGLLRALSPAALIPVLVLSVPYFYRYRITDTVDDQ